MRLSQATGAYNSCAELLDRNIEEGRGDKIAFIDPQASLTYAQLQAQTRRMANLLQKLGIRREERILMVMEDTVEFPVVFLGALRAGVVPVPVNPLLGAEQYAHMIKDSRAQALFVSKSFLASPRCVALNPLCRQHLIVAGLSRGEAPKQGANLASVLAAESDLFETVEVHPDEPAFWLYSSGSTGAPKGAKHVHASLMHTANLFGKRVLGVKEGDVVHSAAKMFFAYGLGNSLSFPMSVGATTVLNPSRPTPAAVFGILGEFEPTIFCGVPTLYAAMLNDEPQAGHPGSTRLRLCVSAGEALPERIGKAWEARFGVAIINGVGTTEMLHIFLAHAPGDVAYCTSGRAVPGYELRLTDEYGFDVSDGEVGELLVKGPTASEGYWCQREKTRSTFEGEWTRTGDKYTRDAAGRYTYRGRANDMFKVSGIWVSPFEIEEALIGHEAVMEAAVVAAADFENLLKPKAFVVLRPGAKAEGLETVLKEHVKEMVGMSKYPRWIVIVDSLPKTATGKIQRFKLRDCG